AFGGEEGDAGVGVFLGEAPGAGVEVLLAREVGHGEVDVPQVGDQAIGHGFLPFQAGWDTRVPMRRTRPGTSPCSWSSSHCPSWLEASTTVLARSCRRAVNSAKRPSST